MTKKIILPLLATVLFIVAVGLFVQKTQQTNFSKPMPQVKPTVSIDGVDISVTTAKTREERERGLSGVADLEANTGMLFIFDDKTKPQVFWMKDTIIPLDIIWIKDGKIIKIDKNVPIPSPGTPDNKLPVYTAGQPVDYVLEVEGGFSDANSISVGDSISISGI